MEKEEEEEWRPKLKLLQEKVGGIVSKNKGAFRLSLVQEVLDTLLVQEEEEEEEEEEEGRG